MLLSKPLATLYVATTMTSRRSMHYLRPSRLFAVALIATAVLVALPSEAAGRRRAASHPTATNKLTAAKISGTVVDDVTGQPIPLLRVRIGDRTDTTDNAGKFEV